MGQMSTLRVKFFFFRQYGDPEKSQFFIEKSVFGPSIVGFFASFVVLLQKSMGFCFCQVLVYSFVAPKFAKK